MKISRVSFLNYLRCPNNYALQSLHKRKTFFNNYDEKEEMYLLERIDKEARIMGTFLTYENSSLVFNNQENPLLSKDLSEFQRISQGAVSKRINDKISISFDPKKQKHYQVKYDDYEFFAFYDGIYETETEIVIIDVKMTSAKKMTDLFYRNNNNEKTPVFEKTKNGIYRLKADYGYNLDKKYYKKEHYFFDRFSDIGRFAYDLSFQRFIYEKANNSEKEIKCYLVLLNNEYRKSDELDIQLVSIFELSRITKEIMPMISRDFHTVIQYLNRADGDIRHIKLGNYCQKNGQNECVLFPYCSKVVKGVPEHNSIFSYLDNHLGFDSDKKNRYELINAGIVRAIDVPRNWLTRRNNVIQRFVMETKEPYIDTAKISLGLSVIKSPIYFLKMKTHMFLLPKFPGDKPFSNYVYCYSVYSAKEEKCDKDKDNSSCFISLDVDERERLLESLMDDLGNNNGTIVVYNQIVEVSRLKELADKYPIHQEKINAIINRIVDLRYIVKGNRSFFRDLNIDDLIAGDINYYHDVMNGSYSFEKLCLALLGIETKENIEDSKNYLLASDIKKEEMKNEIIANCKDYTWRLYLILNKLKDLTLF